MSEVSESFQSSSIFIIDHKHSA